LLESSTASRVFKLLGVQERGPLETGETEGRRTASTRREGKRQLSSFAVKRGPGFCKRSVGHGRIQSHSLAKIEGDISGKRAGVGFTQNPIGGNSKIGFDTELPRRTRKTQHAPEERALRREGGSEFSCLPGLFRQESNVGVFRNSRVREKGGRKRLGSFCRKQAEGADGCTSAQKIRPVPAVLEGRKNTYQGILHQKLIYEEVL